MKSVVLLPGAKIYIVNAVMSYSRYNRTLNAVYVVNTLERCKPGHRGQGSDSRRASTIIQ
jgi:hypothetical protein